jgi:DNA-binding FadR family transcriptional regulator
MISPDSAIAYYVQLAGILRERIRSGAYPPGTMLPSEPRLGQEFGVARETVRRAVRELRIEGLVVIRKGVGTRVVEPSDDKPVALKRGTTFVVRMPTPEDVAEYGVPQGEPILIVTYGVNPPQVLSAGGRTFKTN